MRAAAVGSALARRALRKAAVQVRHVSAIPPRDAEGLVAAVYAQVERDFGMLAPPVALHSPAAAPLAACWVMLRETLIARGLADRAAKEAVAAAVSLGNQCLYCVTVHTAVLSGFSGGADAAAAIAADHVGSVTDPRLRQLAAWALACGRPGTAVLGELPFPAEDLPELAGVVVTFQYLNRMVTVFLGQSPLPATVPASVARTMTGLLGRYLTSTARGMPEPGASLGLLPPAPVAADQHWTAGSPVITDAIARAAAAIEAAGARTVPGPARELVLGHLASWTGEPMGLSSSWARHAVLAVPASHRPAARIALLTALAPYQVGRADIDEFRSARPSDADLIELTSWASMAAALRVGSWLAPKTAPA